MVAIHKKGGGGLCAKIFIMHFYAQNAVSGLYEGRNGRSKKNFFFICIQKWGYTPGITVPWKVSAYRMAVGWHGLSPESIANPSTEII